MKKLTFAALLLILTIVSFSQNLNGKLGTNGQFIIRDTTTTFLTLSQSTGYLSLNRSFTLPYTTSSSLGVIYKGNERFLHNFGTENTFLGVNSGNFIMTGAYNTTLGFYSLLSNTSGNDNTAVGHYSLSANTTGFDNTAVGFLSLRFNTGGSRNTAVGNYSLTSNITGTTNTAIGNESLRNNTLGSENTAIGDQSLFNNITGDYNTGIGPGALALITTGSYNTAIGYNAQVPSATSNNQVRIGGTNVTYAGVQVPWTITSDRRWKSDIQDSKLSLNFINKLRPVSYFRNNDEKQRTEYGFIAQEVEEVLQEEGVENSGMITIDDNGMYEFRYNDLLAPMVKAIQELKAENDGLKENNVKLSAEVESLKSMSEKLVKLEQVINELKIIKSSSLTENK